MVKFDSKEANVRALEFFPQWMDINKRPTKSVGGRYLSAITDENDEIEAAFEDFKNGFFLKRFAGKEEEILSSVYVAHIGQLDGVTPLDDITITSDAKEFLENPDTTALYQDGYILVANGDKETFDYKHGEFVYHIPLNHTALWNVFDEFALFCGLTRYDGETNTQLVNRIYAVFKRPTSSTEDGIKNAIINAVMNYDNLKPEDIIMERPNSENMFLLKDGESVYEKLSAINKDIARKKVWNKSYWENEFKKIEYLNNRWDVPLDVYQKGTGQKNDLSVKLSDSDAGNDTTDINVMGYKTSSKLINDYVRKQGIKKNIPLSLLKYRNELAERTIEYRIEATPAKEINPAMVSVTAKQKLGGQLLCYLENMVEDPGAITEVQHGDISKDTPYTIEFRAADPYSTMEISKCNIVHDDGTITNLLEDKSIENSHFKIVNGVLKNIDVKAHVDKISMLDDARNFEDVAGGGFTIGPNGATASLVFDVSNMQGSPVTVPISCKQSNYTNNENFVTFDGSFALVSDREIIAAGTDSDSKLVIEMDCASIHYELGGNEGCATVEFEIDGELDVDKSGFFTDEEIFDYDFQNSRHVKITITKAGMHPLIVRNIMAARYTVSFSTDIGTPIYTKTYMLLPVVANNRLKITIESLSGYAPKIDYIHIGASLGRAVFPLKVTTKKIERLDIDTNCVMTLLKDGKLLSDNYSTKTSYRNDTKDDATLVVDINNFLSIESSSKYIEPNVYHGRKRGYITLKPGEELESITIIGQMLRTTMSCTLSDLLKIQAGDKVYVAGNASGFITLDENGKTSLIRGDRALFPAETDQVEFENVPTGTKAAFVINSSKNIETINSSLNSGAFEYAYIKTADSKDYVAYNSVTMLQSPMDNVDIVNTFSPTVNLNTLMFYKIVEVKTEGTKASAHFTYIDADNVTLRDWALGVNHNGIRVEYDFAFGNTDAYEMEIGSVDETFSLANNIKLDNEKAHELAQYLITPPDDMRVNYVGETVMERLPIEEDGFNKLWYSNVQEIVSVEIDGETIPQDKYRLIQDAGIIIWNGLSDRIGATADITYRYLLPESLEFKDISSLYELVGYSVDAYEPMMDRPMTIRNLRHGDYRDIVIGGEVPDRIIIRCTNDNFRATVNKARVTVQRQANTSAVMVHSGYYYDKDKEYYLFEHDFEEGANQMRNIELERIQKNSGSLFGIQESGNYLLDTNMGNGKFLEKMCYIDCHDHQDRIEGVSDFKSITACDSYQQWSDFNMDIDLVQGFNGLGLQFHSKGIGAYAILNITDKVESGSYLTFYADASLKALIMREVYAEDDPMRKSVYCEVIGECERADKICSYKFDEVDERRLYLCLSGDGIIDDIIIRKNLDEELETLPPHTKNISMIGFDITEDVSKAKEIPINFNVEGNQFDGLEINDGGILETGATVDWGVTKVINYTDAIEKFICYRVDQRKGALYTGSESGNVRTPWAYISNVSSANTIFVKVNDVLIDSLKDFDIRVFTAGDMYGHGAKEIAFKRKANLIAVPAAAFSSYVQIVVEMPPMRVINSIEIYARYVEKSEHALHVSESLRGTMVSKVYDLVTASDYRLDRIVTDSVTHPENIHVMIRGLRQDDSHAVWTDWYPCELDNSLRCLSSHDFYDYRFFQFKIEISDMDANIKINDFVFEVI